MEQMDIEQRDLSIKEKIFMRDRGIPYEAGNSIGSKGLNMEQGTLKEARGSVWSRVLRME